MLGIEATVLKNLIQIQIYKLQHVWNSWQPCCFSSFKQDITFFVCISEWVDCPEEGGGGGGVNDTPWLWVSATKITLFRSEIFKYTACLGVWLSFMDFLWGGSMVIQISFVMLIFLLFLNEFLFGDCLKEKPAVSPTICQNTEMSCFQRKP